jgi:hypothetical protein
MELNTRLIARFRAWCVTLACCGLVVPLTLSAQAGSSDEKAQSTRTQDKPASTTDQKADASSRVTIDDLEDNAAKYVGKTVTVEGDVANVLGPRLFTIDERNWIDFDGETVVLVPAPFAALIRRDAPVVVTATVRPFVKAEIEREYEWFGNDTQLEVDTSNTYVLVAKDITTLGANALLQLSTGSKPASTRGLGGTPVTDASALAKANDSSMVGRRVELMSARVSGTATGSGFWISPQGSDDRTLVMPATAGASKIAAGQNVMINGVVLELPRSLREKLGDEKARSEQTYIYADHVSTAG